ncbi:MAG: OmpA family protein [Reyranella sp.]|jgi:outer membrane protein OmpA-like peptidoglycan-associated protein|nr:OmpA family protein [Reyranella sp.]MBL6650221.1 OmpA family protein [Reyranella sp.]
MPGAGWGIAIAALALLAACEQEQALQSGDPNYTMVFFATDSVTLNKRAQDTLSAAVKEPTPPVRAALQPQSKAKICVTGHSDNVGADSVKMEVGQRRADAVAKYLVGLGVAQQRMVITSVGSSKPLVVTPPGTPEISNRRVEVVFGC